MKCTVCGRKMKSLECNGILCPTNSKPKRRTVPGGSGSIGYDKPCLAAGVHVDQVPEVMEHDRKHGVPTEYRDGCPVFRDRAHAQKYLKLHKLPMTA